jgi:hypothetical protein
MGSQSAWTRNSEEDDWRGGDPSTGIHYQEAREEAQRREEMRREQIKNMKVK